MNQVPVWLYVIILYFVYDDLWYSESDNPITHWILTLVVVLCSLLFVIGQGRILNEVIRIITDVLKARLPFLR